MKNSKLTPEEAVDRMKVEDGIYFLNAGFEKRMSTISQQVRAISLIGTLKEKGDPETGIKMEPDDPIAIIGGGVAGLTAAVIAAWRGQKNIHVFEKNSEAVTTYDKSKRYIHPRLYEWPDNDWHLEQAAIPALDWNAGSGEKVTKEIRKQWKYWLRYYGSPDNAQQRLYFHHADFLRSERVISEQFDNDSLGKIYSITFASRKVGNISDIETKTGFKWIILATGFGPQVRPKGISPKYLDENKYVFSYWETPLVRGKIAIAGDNDSGLTEVIELSSLYNGDGLTQENLPLLLKKISDDNKESQIPKKIEEINNDLLSKINLTQRKVLIEADESKKSLLEKNLVKLYWEYFNRFKEIEVLEIDEIIDKNVDNSITLLTRNKVENNGKGAPFIKPGAFVLNYFLVTQLIKLGFIELKYCPDAHKILLDSNKFKVPVNKQLTEWEEYKHVIFRLGPTENSATKQFGTKFKKRLTDIGFGDPHQNLPLDIARTVTEMKPADKEWLLFSDLFDSYTQRQVFNALLTEKGLLKDGMLKIASDTQKKSYETAEKEFVDLYKKRLCLETRRRGKIVFIDAQILDGCFFVRWLSKITDTEAAYFKDKLVFRVRGKEDKEPTSEEERKGALEYTWYHNFCMNIANPVDSKVFEFSYLDEVDHRNYLNQKASEFSEKLKLWLKHYQNVGNVQLEQKMENLPGFFKDDLRFDIDDGVFESLKTEWETYSGKRSLMIENLASKGFDVQAFKPGTDGFPFDPQSNFEDPALFSSSVGDWKFRAEALEVVKKMFDKIEKKNPEDRDRGYVRSEIWKEADDNIKNGEREGGEIESEKLKNFYNRAYYRNLARQHHANIFETVNVYESCIEVDEAEDAKQLLKYTPRDGAEWKYEEIEIPKTTLDYSDASTFEELKNEFDKLLNERERQKKFRVVAETPAKVDNETATNLGKSALTLLRGGSNIELTRTPIEEALYVGAQIPIVIDEEKVKGAVDGKDIYLARVEYSYDLPGAKKIEDQ